jgi:hypothetical protein
MVEHSRCVSYFTTYVQHNNYGVIFFKFKMKHNMVPLSVCTLSLNFETNFNNVRRKIIVPNYCSQHRFGLHLVG